MEEIDYAQLIPYDSNGNPIVIVDWSNREMISELIIK